MQKVAFALACLACVGQGRRVHSSTNAFAGEDRSSEEASRTLAQLLETSKVGAAFNPSSGAKPAATEKSVADRVPPVSAQAAAAAGSAPASTDSDFNVKDMAGITAPLGFFDPFGFTKDASPETIKKYREAELKHGRVAMLAAWGMVTADKWHPLFDGKLSRNPWLAIVQTPKLGILQILLFIAFVEVLGVLNTREENYIAGNFLGEPYIAQRWDQDNWKSYQTKELNNGRLAMFGSIGMLTGSYLTGKGPLELLDAGGVILS